MSQLSGGGNRDSRTPSPPTTNNADTFASISNAYNARKPEQSQSQSPAPIQTASSPEPFPDVTIPASPTRGGEDGLGALGNDSQFSPGPGRQRSSSRPLSMIQTYQPLVMDTNNTIPELQPVFTLLNSHANKLYQEGYFLKLDDQNTRATFLSLSPLKIDALPTLGENKKKN